MYLKTFVRKHILLLIAAAAAICYSYPFLIAAYRHSYVAGDDIQTHMQRVEGMLSSYENGHFPARLHISTLRGFAYGMGLFYPQFLLIIPLIMRLLGMNFILSTNFFLVLINVLTVLSVYFCVCKITGSSLAASSSAFMSLITYYRLANMFYRGSLGESIAFIFTPFLILGLYELFHRESSGIFWAVLGLSGILYSHLLSFAFTLTLLLLFILLSVPVWLKDDKIRKPLFIFLFLSLLITSAFWMPFLEQYLSVDLLVKTGYDSPYRPAVPASAALKIVSYWWRTIPANLYDPLCFTFPIILLSFFTGRRRYTLTKILLTVIGFLGLFLSTNLFEWEKFNALHHFIQFPWRLMFLPTAAFPFAFGLALDNLRNRKVEILFAVIICLTGIFFTVPVLENILTNYIVLSPGYRGIQDGVGAGEYLPEGAVIEQIQKQGRNILSNNDGFSYEYSEKGLSAEIHYQSEDELTIELPFLYYKGWVYRTDEGICFPAKHGDHGLVSVDLPKSDVGFLRVYYKKTAVQWAADLFSCLGFICLIVSARKDSKYK